MKLLFFSIALFILVLNNSISAYSQSTWDSGTSQPQEYYYTKDASYFVQCDSLFGKGFIILKKQENGYSILPSDSSISLSLVSNNEVKTYYAVAQKVTFEPYLVFKGWAERKGSQCGEYNRTERKYIVEKSCLYKSRLDYRGELEHSNIPGFYQLTGYRADEIKLLVINTKTYKIEERILSAVDFNNNFEQLGIKLCSGPQKLDSDLSKTSSG